VSGVGKAKDALRTVHSAMVDAGCRAKRIYMCLAAGQIVDPDAEDPSCSGSFELERDLLRYAKKYHVKEAQLHLNNDEDSGVNVVVTARQVYWSRESIFQADQGDQGDSL